MKMFKRLLIRSIVFTTYNITTQVIFATNNSTATIESLLPKRDNAAEMSNLDADDLAETVCTILEEARPVTTPNNGPQAGNSANLKLRAELIKQEILTMNILKVFAVSASIASIAAGSYIAMLLFDK